MSTEELSNIMPELGRLAAELDTAELDLAEAEEALKAAKRRVQDIAEDQIPALMEAVGMSEFKTTSGVTLRVRNVIRVSPPKARREEAWDFVEAAGGGHLVKSDVVASFGTDQHSDANALLDYLRDADIAVSAQRKVEPSTLKRWVRERLEEGLPVPSDVFGVREFKQATITSRPEDIFSGE